MASDPKPILIFPKDSRSDSSREKGKGGGSAAKGYGRDVQKQRLGPKLDNLSRTLQRIDAGEEPEDDGDIIIPDRVLVFQTKEPVEKFWNAVGKIDGLTALAEWLVPARSVDEESPANRGRLYLTLPNKQGLDEILKYWNRYQDGARLPDGLKPLRDLFDQLDDLRRWGLRDRIQPEARAYFEDEIEAIEKNQVPDGIGVEIELWPYETEAEWTDAFAQVRKLIAATEGAEIVNTCRIDRARVGIVLAVIPAALMRELLSASKLPDGIAIIGRADLKALADAQVVQTFGARGQAAMDPFPEEEQERREPDQAISADPEGLATPDSARYQVAVMDTPVMEHHPWLDRRLTISDRFGLSEGLEVKLRHHGTAMASLAIHGDLSASTPLPNAMASVPVMTAKDFGDGRPRPVVPDGSILADVLHMAIRHLFEEDGHGGPAAPEVCVVSLSIGDANRPFVGRVSPAARVLDYLAYEYGILILVSAGNYIPPLDLPMSENEFKALTPERQRKTVLQVLRGLAGEETARPLTILSPAEAVNVLTVGALDDDDDARSAPATSNQVRFRADAARHAPYSRLGPGIEGQIKPDILFSGGSPVYNLIPANGGGSKLRLAPNSRFGLLEARSEEPPADPLRRSVGTSGATASAANAAGRIAAMLRDQTIPEPVPPDYLGILTKALMVHGCQDYEWFEDAAEMHLEAPANSAKRLEDLARFFGHGTPDIARVLECTDTRATVLGFGTLQADKDAAMKFEFPIPNGLSGNAVPRRLTLTLAWFAPCDGRRVIYRRGRLELSMDARRDNLVKDRKGTTGGTGRAFDSRGTVIHQVHEGERVAELAHDSVLSIQVQRANTSGLPATDPLRFGLAVTLDAGLQSSLFSLSIYDEVAQRLGIRGAVPAR